MPAVSVVIGTYNQVVYLSEAIDSILNQTYKDYEIIVIDDGSTDNTADMIKSRYSMVNYIYKKHAGHAPLNDGIENSKGKYIAFLDSDDLWLEDYLKKTVELMEKSSSKVGIIFTRGYIDEGKKKSKSITKNEYRGNVFQKLLMTECMASPSRTLIKMECLEKVGKFNFTLRRSYDTEMWIRISKFYEAEIVEQPLVIKRHIGQHIMTDIKRLDEPELFFKCVFDDPNCTDKVKKLKNKAYAKRHLYYMETYYLNNCVLKMYKRFLKGFFMSPLSVKPINIIWLFKSPLRLLRDLLGLKLSL